MNTISLRSASLRADILPAHGGGLARLDWVGGGGAHAVLRGLDPDAGAFTPSQLACFPLVPWSNRIAPDGFEFEGRRYRPVPNRAGEPCAIHGEGFQAGWSVNAQSVSHVELCLERRSGDPFAYEARLNYLLDGGSLHVTLEVRNQGALAMPFGLGLHPWMRRAPDVLLHAPARKVWSRGELGLPDQKIAIPGNWDFSRPSPLPALPIDNVFGGWNGAARIEWTSSGMALDIAADMGYYIVYAPAGADFFCFEPVDHRINAHNGDGGPAANGLTVLAPGQSLMRSVTFTVSA